MNLRIAWLLLVGTNLACNSSLLQLPPNLAEIAAGEVRIVDLAYPPFQLHILATIGEDGVYSAAFCTPEHLGTHLDAPNHFVAGQLSVEELELPQLVAPLVAVDVRKACRADPDYELSIQNLRLWEARHGHIPQQAVVVAGTGWGRYWNDFKRYKNADGEGGLHFPGFSAPAVRLLVQEKRIKGIGIDTLSVDRGISPDFRVHHIVNGAGGYHLGNVANLRQIPPGGAWLIAAPVKLQGGSGGPARLWAVL